MYTVGDLGLAARRAAAAAARAKKTAAPGIAETPALAPVPKEKQPVGRRRRPKDTMLGRGYEYMDLDQALVYPEPDVAASDRSAGSIGFAGSAARAGADKPGGLVTLTEDQFGGGSSTVPMLPSTWNQDRG
jgi:PPE-repeat protein